MPPIVLESKNVDVFVLQVHASDNDKGNNGKLVYVITSDNEERMFSISNEGKISKATITDPETNSYYNLTAHF